MKIPAIWSPLLVSAVRDALLYQESMLKSDTVRNKEDYKEHIVQLSELLEYIKGEYKAVEEEVGIPLEQLLKFNKGYFYLLSSMQQKRKMRTKCNISLYRACHISSYSCV